MNKNVELKNLSITIDLDNFKDEYKEKNYAFFSLLDKAITDSSITVYRALTDNEYYNLIVVKNNDIYNALPEPLFLEYMSIEQLENKINIEEIEREEIDKIIKSQKETSYTYLKNREDKARLVIKLSKITNGKLTKEEIEEIVNTIKQNEFDIAIIEDAKEFAKKITLIDYDNGYSWECNYWNQVFFMNVEEIDYLGYSRYLINKGEFGFGGENTDPNFNIAKKYVVMLMHEDEEGEHYELVIYLPNNNPYKIDKEIQYVLDNFNIE